MISAALLTGVLGFFQTPQYFSFPPSHRCRWVYADIARAARTAFLSPTDETRSSVTARLDADGVLQAAGTCGVEPEWVQFIDSSAVAAGVPLDRPFRHPNTLTEKDQDSVRRSAKNACEDLTELSPCFPAQLRFLMLARDPLISRQVIRQRLDPASLRWLSLLESARDRPEFLRAAIQADDLQLVQWAIDEAVGALDPRTWRADDVAVLVLEARRLSAELATRKDVPSPLSGLQAAHGPIDASDIRVRFDLIHRRLGRMGFERIHDLIKPQHFALSVFRGLPHFAGERQACIDDWLDSQNRGDYARLSPSERDQSVLDCSEIWWQTDAAAPHGDIRAIQRSVEALSKRFANPK